MPCRACSSRRRCTRSKKDPRGLTISSQAEYTALHTRRQSQETPEFLRIYNQRAGVEATLSQGIRRTWREANSLYWIGKNSSSTHSNCYCS